MSKQTAIETYNKAASETTKAFYACYGGSFRWAGTAILHGLHFPLIPEPSTSDEELVAQIPTGLTLPLNALDNQVLNALDTMDQQLDEAIDVFRGVDSKHTAKVLKHLDAAKALNTQARNELAL